MVTRETERIDVSKKFSREFERKDRVKSEFSYGKVRNSLENLEGRAGESQRKVRGR